MPTAAPSDAGDILVEISHRFGHLSGGASDLWGLDGFVLNRLGLAYAPHDDLTVGILRSNSQDKLEFNARFTGPGFDAPTGPVQFAAQAGVAWNLQVDTGGGHVGHQHVVLHGDKAGTADRSRDEAAEANEIGVRAGPDRRNRPPRPAPALRPPVLPVSGAGGARPYDRDVWTGFVPPFFRPGCGGDSTPAGGTDGVRT